MMGPPSLRRGALLVCLVGLTFRAGLGAETGLADDRALAAAGDPAALVRLAERYEIADGVPFDLGAASTLFQLAAERGNAAAQYRLGLLQAGGLDPDADLAEAYGWLRLAAQSAADAPTGLLAGALSDALAQHLDDATIAKAQERIAAFQPITGPAELPSSGEQLSPGDDPAALIAMLPPLGCGAPETEVTSDGITLLAYAPAGTLADAAITPGIRADLARHGAALDITQLSPAICLIRGLAQQQDPAPDVALAGVADDARALLRDGDKLVIEIAAASEPRYVSVDYVVHTGDVWHLYPDGGPNGGDGYLPAGEALRLGDGSDGPAWQVGAPFGEDLVLVSLSTSPFGADRQPGEEPVDAYQARLQQRLQAPDDPLRLFERVIVTRAR